MSSNDLATLSVTGKLRAIKIGTAAANFLSEHDRDLARVRHIHQLTYGEPSEPKPECGMDKETGEKILKLAQEKTASFFRKRAPTTLQHDDVEDLAIQAGVDAFHHYKNK